MRILGLDLSLTATGYVLLDEDYVLWFGAAGGRELRGEERLQHFDRWIRGALSEVYPVAAKGGAVGLRPLDHVAIEGYSFASQFRGPQLGELGGVIKLAIHQAGVPITIIPPATWKKTLCGKGNLDKRNASVEIAKRYEVSFASEDTLDAWAVAMTLRRQLLGLDKPEPKLRKRKPPAGNQLHIPATEEAHVEALKASGRRTAGTERIGAV